MNQKENNTNTNTEEKPSRTRKAAKSSVKQTGNTKSATKTAYKKDTL